VNMYGASTKSKMKLVSKTEKGGQWMKNFILHDIPRAFLVMIETGIGLILMLVAMTFNVGLFFAVLIGAFFGSLIFARFANFVHTDAACH